MKHKTFTTFLFIAALGLCACTPAIDNGLIRSPLNHLTVPEAIEENELLSENTQEPEIPADQFDSSAAITGFSSDILSKAQTIVSQMSLEEKVGQMFLARCPEDEAAALASQYHLGGYILYGRDFENKTKDQVRSDIASYQSDVSIPLFIAVDEEGGSVIRVSSNPLLRPYPFWSPQELFAEDGYTLVLSDAADKSILLKNLGINMNLAPVCDVSVDSSDYIYARSFGQPAAETAEYVKTVVTGMSQQNMGSVLKHFPGYGNNTDTHQGPATDSRSYESFASGDFLPFKAGIDAGANAVLVSHTIVTCMDSEQPASLSAAVHDILRNDLGFNGIIMTDDLSMEAISLYSGALAPAVTAVLAGNDMICTDNFSDDIAEVIDAVNAGTISEARIDQAAARILCTKIQLGLIN